MWSLHPAWVRVEFVSPKDTIINQLFLRSQVRRLRVEIVADSLRALRPAGFDKNWSGFRASLQYIIKVQGVRNTARGGDKMVTQPKKQKVIGYYVDDGNIYCVDCIKKSHKSMKEAIEDAISSEDLEGHSYVCEECKKTIK
jgi:hypothetical protein